MAIYSLLFALSLNVLFLLFLKVCIVAGNLWSWQRRDVFDEIQCRMQGVTEDNCRSKPLTDLYLPKEVVSQLPRYNKLRTHFYDRNRTGLVHLHNSALNRAFFHSFVLQRFNRSREDFVHLPGWQHLYFGVAADISANPGVINGSGIYFDNHCYYPNWINNFAFNKTLPLFAPVAWRYDDYRDSGNFLREPTLRRVRVMDWGAGQGNYTQAHNKVNPWYNLWQMPDLKPNRDSRTKFTYSIGIKYSDHPGRFNSPNFEIFQFYGPSQPGQYGGDEELPVRFTQPYFDCGKSNQWVVSAVAPVIDYMSRYSSFPHIRRPRIVGLVSMEIYFRKIDFNACPVSLGNPGPSILSGIDRCKQSTQCKHISGFGYKRGGYKCVCRPGYRYPYHIDPPFKGSVIEKATDTEYQYGFQCLPIQRKRVHAVENESWFWSSYESNEDLKDNELFFERENKIEQTLSNGYGQNLTSTESHSRALPQPTRSTARTRASMQDSLLTKRTLTKNMTGTADQSKVVLHKNISTSQIGEIGKKTHSKKSSEALVDSGVFLTRSETGKFSEELLTQIRNHRVAFESRSATQRARFLLSRIKSVNKFNCRLKSKSELLLPGSTSYGVEAQFEPQARTALRLAHFLSSYYQNSDSDDNFGILKGGKYLHEDLLFGEVLSNIMADHRVVSSGIFFDEYQFRRENNTPKKLFGPWAFKNGTGVWAIDSSGLPKPYTEELWFRTAKYRYRTNTFGLERYWLKPYVRIDAEGSSNTRFNYHTMTFMGPKLNSGQWHRARFLCDGRINDWVIKYTVPFFGVDNLRHRLIFLGIVMIDVPLLQLDITQCPQPFYIANAFKNTAKCPNSAKCFPIPGFGLTLGGYGCKCRQGYEYPFHDGRTWIAGFTLEQEWLKENKNIKNRLHLLKCRVSSGNKLFSSSLKAILTLNFIFYLEFSN